MRDEILEALTRLIKAGTPVPEVVRTIGHDYYTMAAMMVRQYGRGRATEAERAACEGAAAFLEEFRDSR